MEGILDSIKKKLIMSHLEYNNENLIKCFFFTH